MRTKSGFAARTDQIAQLMPHKVGDRLIVELEMLGLGSAADEDAQENGAGRGSIGELHAQERHRQDRPTFDGGHDRRQNHPGDG